MRHDSPERGTQVLADLHGLPVSHPVVKQEKLEIMEAIALEQEGRWSDLFKDGGVSGDKRFYLALGIQFMQQFTGTRRMQKPQCNQTLTPRLQVSTS